MGFIAHVVDKNNTQSVATHLQEVAEWAKQFSNKIGLGNAGELIGLVHDFGKYSECFQKYIQRETGLINPDRDDEQDLPSQKGKIDHSTAGAQLIWSSMIEFAVKQTLNDEERNLAITTAQILALCVASHHGGLIDCAPSDKAKGFMARIEKSDQDTHLSECKQQADSEILVRADELLQSELLSNMIDALKSIQSVTQADIELTQATAAFYTGMFTKFLFSCLIDADRISSADFELPENKAHRDLSTNWSTACDRVESFISGLKVTHDIDTIRADISNTCKQKAYDEQGIKSLTVPTGGGKTYASLRYAVHHAKHHKLDRIIYIIPFTSIIDQNARAIKKVLEQEGDEHPWVFEHHSNLEPEQQTWRSKLVCENWDAPIVLTTMVQFLETIFGSGTRGIRRLHQLANSVLIFDEIQSLPINCVHLFNNAVNFLAAHCGTTAVMCTATQPLLNKLRKPELGQLALSPENEIMPDVSKLFDDLKRVEVVNKITKDNSGWSVEQLTEFALTQLNEVGSCLVVVNTKKWAERLYQACAYNSDTSGIYHLSTAQCSTHRKEILDEIRQRLDDDIPTLCISTQLIEAGVDVDFASAIRFVAGLDSIAQSAGRCNRNGKQDLGYVYLVDPDKETIDSLEDIKVGQKVIQDQILSEFQSKDILLPQAMTQYFEYYFHRRHDCMAYSLPKSVTGGDDSILNLLSLNSYATCNLPMPQSFKTASKAFKAIDAPTRSVLVPYKDGADKITELCALSKTFDAKRYKALLVELQKYSVNVFDNVWRQLVDEQAVVQIEDEWGNGSGIYYLKQEYYSESLGLCTEPVSSMGFQYC